MHLFGFLHDVIFTLDGIRIVLRLTSKFASKTFLKKMKRRYRLCAPILSVSGNKSNLDSFCTLVASEISENPAAPIGRTHVSAEKDLLERQEGPKVLSNLEK